MVQWLIVGLSYTLGFGLFAVLGGLSSAGEAFRSWGESVATRRDRAAASS
jgi:hypothetical protein